VSRVDLSTVDFFAPSLQAQPRAFDAQLLAEAPMLALPGTDIHLVSSHALVSEACGRPDDFSNDITTLLAGRHAATPAVQAVLERGWPQQNVLLMSDPPSHSRYRKLVSQAFSLKRVDAIEQRIRAIAGGLVVALKGTTACDFVAAFAVPLPVSVIAGELGLPPGDAERVRQWTSAFTDRLGGMISAARELECAHEIVDFQQAIKAQIDARFAEPREDLLSDLVRATVEGEEPLSIAELLSIIQQLVVAGNETTTNTLSEGLLALIDQPAAMAELRANPALISNAVEEILRFASPVQGNWRIVARDCELGGVQVAAGSKLMLRIGAANRDPARFADPAALQPGRANARAHLAFGRGIHVCIGNLLARRELAVAFELLLARLDDITLNGGETALHYAPNVMLRGLTALPIRYTYRH
jgi:cytochrome P450